MPTIQIKHRWTDAVLYEHETTEERQASGLALRDALEAASDAGANLADANLADANLADANLAGANLARAYLADANLAGANLARAYLAGANLADANLAGANLARAYLAGANLAGASLADANLARAYLAGAYLARAYLAGAYLDGEVRLVGTRPVLRIGPIGSRSAITTLWLTDHGPRVSTGCYSGTLDQFEQAVAKQHYDSPTHFEEYHAAIVLMRAHARLWTPAAVATAEPAASEAA